MDIDTMTIGSVSHSLSSAKTLVPVTTGSCYGIHKAAALTAQSTYSRAVGASSSRNSRGRNTRTARDGEAAEDEEESNEAETGEEDLDRSVEDEDVEDDYGMGSDPGQYSDHEGYKDFDY
ncbi:hypothetical protein ACET3Z_018352 [Daucus carota]